MRIANVCDVAVVSLMSGTGIINSYVRGLRKTSCQNGIFFLVKLRLCPFQYCVYLAGRNIDIPLS